MALSTLKHTVLLLAESNTKMNMLTRIKINTATLICFAFIFRLLFVNIGIIPFFNTHHNSASVSKHISAPIKRTKTAEVADNTRNSEYSTLEICEEGPDDENQFKLNCFTLVKPFYALSIDKAGHDLKQKSPFYQHLSYITSHRYLAFQVFRI
ncbi:MAG: hypothetical protein HY062_02460 [Bacteroidetes bacterium]|nr:hypothetical protein [Bacteroidota bacterium]